MTTVTVKTGVYAEQRYRAVERQTFHTEFAARLFGWLNCAALGVSNHYWVLDK